MTAYYVDTSALVKRYVDEVGSVWLRALLDPAVQPVIVVSQLLIAEMTSAFTRRVREGTLSREDYARLQDVFRNDCLTEYQAFPVSQAVIDLAGNLMERHPLRTLDALHLATGLLVRNFLSQQGMEDVVLISADERLLVVAAAEGMTVDNPVRHP